ncbi:MAG: GNAT family N-acetyltransferase [Fulvivirga sp.]|nr:GNAT family N-acetyltransferase [Fulvivirga sp.]
MITVVQINTEQELEQAFQIREKVYIEEQQIDREDEFDAYDEEAEHFLAKEGDKPCGTARYRHTDEGIKLERFATLPGFRRRGVASLLMHTMLEHIQISGLSDKKVYLSAQVDAMPLYTKFGFKPEGERFMECNIEHQKMVWHKD